MNKVQKGDWKREGGSPSEKEEGRSLSFFSKKGRKGKYGNVRSWRRKMWGGWGCMKKRNVFRNEKKLVLSWGERRGEKVSFPRCIFLKLIS